jgi:hypothetical protein
VVRGSETSVLARGFRLPINALRKTNQIRKRSVYRIIPFFKNNYDCFLAKSSGGKRRNETLDVKTKNFAKTQ